jgi:hypothetical protein
MGSVRVFFKPNRIEPKKSQTEPNRTDVIFQKVQTEPNRIEIVLNRTEPNRSSFLKSLNRTEPNRVKIFNKLTNVLVSILDKVTKSRDSARIILGFRLASLIKISWIQELGFKSSSCFFPFLHYFLNLNFSGVMNY